MHSWIYSVIAGRFSLHVIAVSRSCEEHGDEAACEAIPCKPHRDCFVARLLATTKDNLHSRIKVVFSTIAPNIFISSVTSLINACLLSSISLPLTSMGLSQYRFSLPLMFFLRYALPVGKKSGDSDIGKGMSHHSQQHLVWNGGDMCSCSGSSYAM